MNLDDAVDCLAEQFDAERSEHVRQTGHAVANLQD